MVVAVNGRRISGNIPEPEFGHEQDNGRGRLIPATSIEQCIAPLANAKGRYQKLKSKK
ncbi:MAG: hypothetical protein KTR16_10315 [Acidiferrobacterales bacterium]|nr:hypothetical protein [Acidiferrobacterales bacterium]